MFLSQSALWGIMDLSAPCDTALLYGTACSLPRIPISPSSGESKQDQAQEVMLGGNTNTRKSTFPPGGCWAPILICPGGQDQGELRTQLKPLGSVSIMWASPATAPAGWSSKALSKAMQNPEKTKLFSWLEHYGRQSSSCQQGLQGEMKRCISKHSNNSTLQHLSQNVLSVLLSDPEQCLDNVHTYEGLVSEMWTFGALSKYNKSGHKGIANLPVCAADFP